MSICFAGRSQQRRLQRSRMSKVIRAEGDGCRPPTTFLPLNQMLLSDDLWIRVMSLLSMKDIGCLQATCRDFDRILLQRGDELYQAEVNRLQGTKPANSVPITPKITMLSTYLDRLDQSIHRLALAANELRNAWSCYQSLMQCREYELEGWKTTMRKRADGLAQVERKITQRGFMRRGDALVLEKARIDHQSSLMQVQIALGDCIMWKKLFEEVDGKIARASNRRDTLVEHKNVLLESQAAVRRGSWKDRLQEYDLLREVSSCPTMHVTGDGRCFESCSRGS
eukprot:jgi/Botrbrau1/13841/Bobra.0056s0078.1